MINPSDGDRYFVDWCEPVQTLENMKRVAAVWAEATHKYITTGRGF
jgi:hypothetical protein